MTCGIYIIENIVNGKCYIGQSVNIENRFKKHISNSTNINHKQYHSLLYEEIRKFGKENFIFDILEECEKQELNNREIFWITYYDSCRGGYNQSSGGSGRNGNSSKISWDDFDNIIDDLRDDKLTYFEIAKKYNINKNTVININLGKTLYNKYIKYPIREVDVEFFDIDFSKKRNLFCLRCGCTISRNSKSGYCTKCQRFLNRKAIHPSREELKKQIRNISFTEIGKMYGVTDKAICKWCKSYSLPYRKKDINAYSDEEWDMI